MIIVGDIGNTETKIFLISSNAKILKRINLNTKKINLLSLSNSFSGLKLENKETVDARIKNQIIIIDE